MGINIAAEWFFKDVIHLATAGSNPHDLDNNRLVIW